MLSRPDGFMLCGKLGVDVFSNSELLHSNKKFRLRLISARLDFYMISDNPNVSLGKVDCSLHTRCIALKDDYHKKNAHACIYFCGLQLYRNSSKHFCHCRYTKPFHSRKLFQQWSSSSNCHCNEYKFSIYRIVK